jgi:DnaJ-class molecular chaperone
MYLSVRDYYDVIGVKRNAGAAEVRRASRRVSRLEPWHDDVAIDFPSAARMADRIRASFFGRDAHPGFLVAELSISRDEARLGGEVPLMIPVGSVCPSCGGRGEVWLDPCAPCAGSGEMVAPRRIAVTLPAGTEDGAVFRFALPAHPADGASRFTSIEIRVAVR